MNMENISDEMLVAYVDSQLSDSEMKRVSKLIKNNDSILDRVNQLEKSHQILKDYLIAHDEKAPQHIIKKIDELLIKDKNIIPFKRKLKKIFNNQPAYPITASFFIGIFMSSNISTIHNIASINNNETSFVAYENLNEYKPTVNTVNNNIDQEVIKRGTKKNIENKYGNFGYDIKTQFLDKKLVINAPFNSTLKITTDEPNPKILLENIYIEKEITKILEVKEKARKKINLIFDLENNNLKISKKITINDE